MADNRYTVELAKSGRSKCKDKPCSEMIDAGALRIGKITKNPFGDGDGDMTTWYHAACIFNALKRARGTTKKIEETDDLEGYDDLDKSDQKEIKDLISGKTPAGKASKKGKTASKKTASKKKKKDESEDEESDEESEEEAPKKKKPAAKKKAASKKSPSRSRSPSPAPKKGSAKKKGGGGAKRYFEQDTKFWECSQDGNEFTARWGKIGANGQSKTQSFKDEAECTKKLEALIRSKEKSGYEEQ